MKAQHVGNPYYRPFTFPVRLENAIVAYARYVQKMFWPSGLAPMYLHPGNSIKVGAGIPGAGFPAGGHGAGGSLLASPLPHCRLAVVSGNNGAHDWPRAGGKTVHGRPLCLPASSGAVHPALLGCGRLCPGLASSSGIAAGDQPRCVGQSGGAHLSSSWLLGRHRQALHTLEVTDRNWFAESYLGDALRYTGHQDEAALQHYSKSLEINPGNIEANLGLALYEHQTGNLRESVDYYKKFLAKAGGDERCYRVLINLGHVYRRLGDAERAQQYFEEAAKIAPKEHATLP